MDLRKYVSLWDWNKENTDILIQNFYDFKNHSGAFENQTYQSNYFNSLVEIDEVDANRLHTVWSYLRSIIPHSMSVERVFSIMSWINSPRRSNMSLETLEMLSCLAIFWRKERSKNNQPTDRDLFLHSEAIDTEQVEEQDDKDSDINESVDRNMTNSKEIETETENISLLEEMNRFLKYFERADLIKVLCPEQWIVNKSCTINQKPSAPFMAGKMIVRVTERKRKYHNV